jgi:purine nucleoside phosphorylase
LAGVYASDAGGLLAEKRSAQAEIGVIGGSGLYAMPGLGKVKEVRLKTPFGAPSDAYVCGTIEGRKVAFLARHGRGHRILPSELNFRANIHGFKQLGVERIVSISAVGSLKEEHKPLDFVIPTSFSIAPAIASILFSAAVWWRTLPSPIRFAQNWQAWLSLPAKKSA